MSHTNDLEEQIADLKRLTAYSLSTGQALAAQRTSSPSAAQTQAAFGVAGREVRFSMDEEDALTNPNIQRLSHAAPRRTQGGIPVLPFR